MRDRNVLSAVSVVFALLFLLLLANNAQAYIGPGAGLDLIPYAVSLGSVMVAASFGILLWPFYAVLRLIRGKRETHREPRIIAAMELPVEGAIHS